MDEDGDRDSGLVRVSLMHHGDFVMFRRYGVGYLDQRRGESPFSDARSRKDLRSSLNGG